MPIGDGEALIEGAGQLGMEIVVPVFDVVAVILIFMMLYHGVMAIIGGGGGDGGGGGIFNRNNNNDGGGNNRNNNNRNNNNDNDRNRNDRDRRRRNGRDGEDDDDEDGEDEEDEEGRGGRRGRRGRRDRTDRRHAIEDGSSPNRITGFQVMHHGDHITLWWQARPEEEGITAYIVERKRNTLIGNAWRGLSNLLPPSQTPQDQKHWANPKRWMPGVSQYVKWKERRRPRKYRYREWVKVAVIPDNATRDHPFIDIGRSTIIRGGGWRQYMRPPAGPARMGMAVDERLHRDSSIRPDSTYVYQIYAINAFGTGAPVEGYAQPRNQTAPDSLSPIIDRVAPTNGTLTAHGRVHQHRAPQQRNQP